MNDFLISGQSLMHISELEGYNFATFSQGLTFFLHSDMPTL